MPFTDPEIRRLLSIVLKTEEDEIGCEACLARVAEFAETHLAGKSVPESLLAVEQHLAVCGECHEEYEALRRTLAELDG